MNKEKLKYSALKGLLASLFTGVIMYYGVRAWIITNISLGAVDKLYSVANAATALATILAFTTATMASYTTNK